MKIKIINNHPIANNLSKLKILSLLNIPKKKKKDSTKSFEYLFNISIYNNRNIHVIIHIKNVKYIPIISTPNSRSFKPI